MISHHTAAMYTVFQKTHPLFYSGYSFVDLASILIIFGINVNEKLGSQRYFTFPPHLTSTFALPGEMKREKNSILSLKCYPVALPDFNQLIYSLVLLLLATDVHAAI